MGAYTRSMWLDYALSMHFYRVVFARDDKEAQAANRAYERICDSLLPLEPIEIEGPTEIQ